MAAPSAIRRHRAVTQQSSPAGNRVQNHPFGDATLAMTLTLQQLNAAPMEDLMGSLHGLYEQSPWVVRQALETRPRTLAEFKIAMARVVTNASRERRTGCDMPAPRT